MSNTPSDPAGLAYAIQVLTFVGGVTALLTFLAMTAYLFIKLGVFGKTLQDLVVQVKELDGKVDKLQSESDQAKGRREEAQSHLTPVPAARVRTR